MPVPLLQKLSQPLTILPFVEPVTSLVIQGMLAAFSVSYLTKKVYGDQIHLGVFTPGGIILIAYLVSVDYWSYKGYTASTYVGNLLLSNADLMAFFLGLMVLGSLIDWDFPDKWATFKNTLQV